MILYRIAYRAYADLSGIGGLTTSGRWTQQGYPVVYFSESLSLAAWEKLMQFESVKYIPNVYVSLTIEVPENSIQTVTKEELDKSIKDWDFFPHHSGKRIIVTNFLKDKKYLLLRVPSAVIQEEFNYIMNPMHPLSVEAKIIETKPFLFDEHLKTKK